MSRSLTYHRPADVRQAVTLLGEAAQAGLRAKVLAGGTALVPRLREDSSTVDWLVSLKEIGELRSIAVDEDRLRLGAQVTLDQLARSAAIGQHAPILAKAAGVVGGPQIRHVATVGGNLCQAAPYSDLSAPLLLLQATVLASSASGQREIPIERFFAGPQQTTLRPDELVTEIAVSRRAASRPALYDKLTLRRAMGIGIVNVAVSLVHRGGRCEDAGIAMSAVAPTPIRAREAEALLSDQVLSEGLIDMAAEVASEALQPADDVRASAWYRKRMARVMIRRSLRRLWKEGA